MSGAARREFGGELLGTLLLVFFGCGSVASAVLTGSAPGGVFQVPIVWGIGIALAIQLTASLSGAHLNPAVTLALASSGRIAWGRVPRYLLAQFTGAFLAAGLLHLAFGGAIEEFESARAIVRGQPGSEASAIVFAEFFPNPAGQPLAVASLSVGPWRAFLVELIGTAVLLLVILGVTDERNAGRGRLLAPWSIGLTVTALIALFGPLTMAAFNPARDLAPRLYSALAGWGSWPFLANGWGWLTVYVLAPVFGAQLGAALYRGLLAPAYAATAPVSSHHVAD